VIRSNPDKLLKASSANGLKAGGVAILQKIVVVGLLIPMARDTISIRTLSSSGLKASKSIKNNNSKLTISRHYP
jgi:hypothetical protein